MRRREPNDFDTQKNLTLIMRVAPAAARRPANQPAGGQWMALLWLA